MTRLKTRVLLLPDHNVCDRGLEGELDTFERAPKVLVTGRLVCCIVAQVRGRREREKGEQEDSHQ